MGATEKGGFCNACGKPRDLAYAFMCDACIRSGVPIPDPSSEGQSPSANAPGTGGSPNPERENCPTCGFAVTSWSGDDGTSHYLALDEDVAGAELERMEADVLDMHDAFVDAGLEGNINSESIVERTKAMAALLREAEAREEELRRHIHKVDHPRGPMDRCGQCAELGARVSPSTVEEELREALAEIEDDLASWNPGQPGAVAHALQVARMALVYGPSAKGSSPESRPCLDGHA